MGYARIDAYAKQLLEGVPAAEVISAMKLVFLTDCSLKNYMSRVRIFVLECPDERKYHPKYRSDMRKLVRLAKSRNMPRVRDAVSDFVKLSFKDQFMRRRFRNAGISVTGDDGVDECLSKIRFLAPNIVDFRTDMKNTRDCRRATEQHRLIANENLKVIADATVKMETCRSVLVVAAKAHRDGYPVTPPVSVPRVAIAMLVLSGRRTAEILNGKSRFEPGRTSQSAIFTGQLKTHMANSYEIPLLCSYVDFRDAYAYLKHFAPAIDSSSVNSKYASNLGYWSLRMFGKGVTPHDLRRLYATYVYEVYGYRDDRVSTNAVIKWLLGHSGLGTSLNYTGIIADGISEKFDRTMRIPLPKTEKN
jgi:integrase